MVEEVVKIDYTQYNRVVHCFSFLKSSYYFNSFAFDKITSEFQAIIHLVAKRSESLF